MSIAIPATHTGYPFRAATLLSLSHETECQWRDYTLNAMLIEGGKCRLTIAQKESLPHIDETFEDDAACLRYLREHDLPTGGWTPVELVREPVLRP